MAAWEWVPGPDEQILQNSAWCANCNNEVTAGTDPTVHEPCPCGAITVYGGTVLLGRQVGSEAAFHDSSLIGKRH